MTSPERPRIARILFAGGGTGGHLYMAIAVAQTLRDANPASQFLFVGTPEGLEARIVPQQGYALETIQIGGIKNVGIRRLAQTAVQLPMSLLQSLRIVSGFRPDAVLGVGGYASGPVVLAAFLRRIPTVIIEPNVEPGLANRLLRPLVDRIAVAFEETAARLGAKALITGVPIREEFFTIRDHEFNRDPLTVLVFGGSRGSRPINQLVSSALPLLKRESIHLIHQTGPADYEGVRDNYRKADLQAEVLPYIDDMPGCFARADLIVSRSGASTVAEITAAGRPALLIPFPHAADDHQTKNARALETRGAAIVMVQKTASGEALAAQLSELAHDRGRLSRMADASRDANRPGATRAVIRLLEEAAA
jgi:UDP-N-acetylglucosamine--N-acetylmuramyl-(pentapeptide) pyrophosphoryl-undecaprenol N-acetylglucosamine transferase